MKTYCNVQSCRFPHSHVSRAHKCGKCHMFGHGQVECGNGQLIRRINEPRHYGMFGAEIYKEPIIDHPCTNTKCKQPTTHTIDAHHKEFEDTELDMFFNRVDKLSKDVLVNKIGYYVNTYVGHGTFYIYKNNNGKIELKIFGNLQQEAIDNFIKDYKEISIVDLLQF